MSSASCGIRSTGVAPDVTRAVTGERMLRGDDGGACAEDAERLGREPEGDVASGMRSLAAP